VNPRKHPIAHPYDPIADALEQAVGPMHGRRQTGVNPVTAQTLTGLGAGGQTMERKGS
jgi:hypothetical protein